MSQQPFPGVVAITGGANGLGLAIAKRFAHERFKVAILDIEINVAENEVQALKNNGAEALAAYLDVSKLESIEQAFDLCRAEFSRLDVLVCCAGLSCVKPFLEVSPSEWDQTFAVNTRGLFFCNQKAAKIMADTGGGRIINVSSPASYLGLPFYTAYAASKAAVDSITRSAAIALAPSNIRVNSLAPGRMDTRMQESSERLWAQYAGVDYEEFVESRTRSLPLKRRATLEEISDAVLFLASSSSDYMTGSRLNISGGLELS
jgi:NAD(P)-dependent dehydrogenase (short-subunit alcohol dehydrogenase family)